MSVTLLIGRFRQVCTQYIIHCTALYIVHLHNTNLQRFFVNAIGIFFYLFYGFPLKNFSLNWKFFIFNESLFL
jgi:hypothetical protein